MSFTIHAQTDTTKTFKLDLEFRPRMEYRDGYRQLPNDTSSAAYFGTQRSRLNFTYEQNKFKFHTSIQDIRVWGQYGQSSTSGSLNVFEAYVESYFTKNLFIRMGRQKVELDNGRIFSAANWSQAGRAHDGINLIYKNEKITSEFMTFFNQTSEKIVETDFSPATFTNYKTLNIHYLNLKLGKGFTLTTINAADGYQSKLNTKTLYVRGTSGGRIEYENGNINGTVSGYYQYGKLQAGNNISAYYIQPEISIKLQKFKSRLGFEYMSGDDATLTSNTSKSFVPLYGVAWKFMGNMDYFTSFPKDLKNGGLFNPYLFLFYEVNKKITVRADAHLFFLQNNVSNANMEIIDKYLGFENDLSIKYKANNFTTIDFGVSYMFAEKSMETLKGGNSERTPVWSYLMITFKPELFKQTIKIKSL
ncbi:MAG: alginate export family protein [Sphingobacteriaceae bacterium]|nr:alginate export family protein [Sphingobacteriaceae bacterium]